MVTEDEKVVCIYCLRARRSSLSVYLLGIFLLFPHLQYLYFTLSLEPDDLFYFSRGLTPPHRVKSISMASFTDDEIALLKSRGNEASDK